MPIPAPALLLIAAAAVTIEVEAVEGVTPELARDLSDALVNAIAAHTRLPVEARAAPSHGEGASPPSVRVRMFGGLTKIRLIAERAVAGSYAPISVEADLSRSPDAWSDALSAIAQRLFPDEKQLPPAIAIAEPQHEESHLDPVPLALAGGALAAATTAIVFAASSFSARGSIENEPHTSAELDDLSGRMHGQAVASGVLASVAAGLLIAGIITASN